MDIEQIKALLLGEFVGDRVDVDVDGSHVKVIVVSEQFAGKRAVQRQQMVYKVLNDAIASGAVHAVHMRTHTPDEWTGA